jgi:hypothetical protein
MIFFSWENDLFCSLDPGHGVELSQWGGEHKDCGQQQGVSQCQPGQPYTVGTQPAAGEWNSSTIFFSRGFWAKV